MAVISKSSSSTYSSIPPCSKKYIELLRKGTHDDRVAAICCSRTCVALSVLFFSGGLLYMLFKRSKRRMKKKRTLVHALNMRLWYASTLELPDGTVLKGATLVAIRPTESKKEVFDISWVSSTFEEPYEITAKMLVRKRIEMNSI